MGKQEVIEEVRRRAESARKWRRWGSARHRYQTPKNTAYYAALKAWAIGLHDREESHPVLAWGAMQIYRSANEYAARDYNACRCRLRRLERALVRWEQRNVCPVKSPSRYSKAADGGSHD